MEGDDNGDGVLEFSEFLVIVRKINPHVEVTVSPPNTLDTHKPLPHARPLSFRRSLCPTDTVVVVRL